MTLMESVRRDKKQCIRCGKKNTLGYCKSCIDKMNRPLSTHIQRFINNPAHNVGYRKQWQDVSTSKANILMGKMARDIVYDS